MLETTIAKINTMKDKTKGYWSERILAELQYAIKLSKVSGEKFDELISKACDLLYEKFVMENTITKASAEMTEDMIVVMSEEAKKFKMICAAHAHIDMNWMWGFAETVAITLDTFRTILGLMEEYPDFKFSQSQASVYKIVEEYDAEMLQRIKQRVKEGRWEVTASTWVETDKNMPNGESLCRHVLYTKKYLSRILDIPMDSLKLDFEPDTFGHSLNVPEILNNGGIKYYYHCRGFDEHNIYKWEAPSGSSVLVYREPIWYNAYFDSSAAFYVPEFCAKHGIDTMLKVYGVGDHGGGPTRRDIEKIMDMRSWPVFPEIRFGTFHEFFEILYKAKHTFPVVKKELNHIFSGCYSSQTRIKTSNRMGEVRLGEAEEFCTFSALQNGSKYPGMVFENAWRKLLFNHFHDIITGSGVNDTRECALGEFQKVLASANTEMSRALRNISSKINTMDLVVDEEDISGTNSEGAGVGYAVKDFALPQTERGRGASRIFHVFNSSAHDRVGPVEITVWDWTGKPEEIQFVDSKGCTVRHQLLSWGKEPSFEKNHYWGHWYMKVLVDVNVPSCGYATYILKLRQLYDIALEFPKEPVLEKTELFVMENGFIRAEFDSVTASIVSVKDKRTGFECVDHNKQGGVFRYIQEDDGKGMTAWYVGRYKHITSQGKNVKFGECSLDKEALRQFINYEFSFGESKISVIVSLDYNSSMLDFKVQCDWREVGRKASGIPQLGFYLPLAYRCRNYRYDVPLGVITRNEMDMDVPANSWMAGIPESDEQPAFMLITDSKYGFRGYDNSLAVTLIRSSYDPDPYPEVGIHNFGFSIGPVEKILNSHMIGTAYNSTHHMHFVSAKWHEGKLSPNMSYLRLASGNIAISGIKMPEETTVSNEMVIRVYETEGTKTEAVLQFTFKVIGACWVDINENELCCDGVKIDNTRIEFMLEPHAMRTLKLKFEI